MNEMEPKVEDGRSKEQDKGKQEVKILHGPAAGLQGGYDSGLSGWIIILVNIYNFTGGLAKKSTIPMPTPMSFNDIAVAKPLWLRGQHSNFSDVPLFNSQLY